MSDISAGDGNIEKAFYGVLSTLCSCCEDISFVLKLTSSHKSHQSSMVVAIESAFAVSVVQTLREGQKEKKSDPCRVL